MLQDKPKGSTGSGHMLSRDKRKRPGIKKQKHEDQKQTLGTLQTYKSGSDKR